MDGTFFDISGRQQANQYFPVEPTLSVERNLQNLFGCYGAPHLSQIDSLDQLRRWLDLETNLTGRARFLDYPQQDFFVGTVPAIDTTKLGQIGSLYSIHDYEEVLNFVKKNVFLIDILLDAFPKLQKYFGMDVKVDLVLRTDPEEYYQELFGYIKTSRSIDESHASLEEFDDHWFLDRLNATRGLLNFNLVFS